MNYLDSNKNYFHQFIICLFLYLLIYSLPISNANNNINVQITKGNWYETTINYKSDHRLHYEISVINGSEIDVYLMNYTELINYRNNVSFSPLITYENSSFLNEKYENNLDEKIHFIVDNRNNLRNSDALPEGNVTVRITINKHPQEINYIHLSLLIGSIIIMCFLLFRLFQKSQKEVVATAKKLEKEYLIKEANDYGEKSKKMTLFGLISLIIFPFGLLPHFILFGCIAGSSMIGIWYGKISKSIHPSKQNIWIQLAYFNVISGVIGIFVINFYLKINHIVSAQNALFLIFLYFISCTILIEGILFYIKKI